VRFGRYVALELAVLLFAMGGGLLGGGRAASAIARRLQVEREGRVLAERLPVRTALSRMPEPAIALEPTGTFLGMSDELLLARVRKGRIVASKLNVGGSSLSFRLDFADGSRAAFKPLQTNLQTIPRKEVAAYRLNRLLGLNAVPPAAPRVLSREELVAHLKPDSLPSLPRITQETIFDGERTAGVVSYWIPKIVDSGLDTPAGQAKGAAWLAVGNPISADDRAMAAQLSNLVVFDFLTANPDRLSGGNMKMSPDAATLFFMDNTMSFFIEPTGKEKNREALARVQRFSRRLHGALARVTEANVTAALAEEKDPPYAILTPSEIRALIARRKFVEKHIQGLVAMHGEQQVLVFP
jgi:hypothetical protein